MNKLISEVSSFQTHSTQSITITFIFLCIKLIFLPSTPSQLSFLTINEWKVKVVITAYKTSHDLPSLTSLSSSNTVLFDYTGQDSYTDFPATPQAYQTCSSRCICCPHKLFLCLECSLRYLHGLMSQPPRLYSNIHPLSKPFARLVSPWGAMRTEQDLEFSGTKGIFSGWGKVRGRGGRCIETSSFDVV